ncbi:MAG: metal ABC transporter solute-binding protein, Zn/Mn family [Acidimicrobiales bacterium]
MIRHRFTPEITGRRVARLIMRPGALVLAGSLALGACSSSTTAAVGGSAAARVRVIHVVAAENFWGSIASQIGGVHVRVVSIITNPDTDPHAFEPTVQDARTVAGAQLVIENGIGYDPWMDKLRSADTRSPTVLDVGSLLGVADGGNPHRWYNPVDVGTVINAMVGDYQKLDPTDTGYFAAQRVWFDNVALQPYKSLISTIRGRYAGTPVGASESIFSMLAPALGLDLITPYSFLKAISEGSDVSAADKQTIDDQIKYHRIKIYVYNSQNVTPDVRAQLAEVRAAHIPYVAITETLVPATTTYQAWQTAQLRGIDAALAQAARAGP